MKIKVMATTAVKVIDIDSNDWEMNGRKGTAYKAFCHVRVDGKPSIDEVKITENVYNSLILGKDYYFGGELDVKNGRFVADSATVAEAPKAGTATASGK